MDLNLFKKQLKTYMLEFNCGDDNNITIESLDHYLSCLLNKHAPKKSIKIKEKRSEWWNSKCDDARRERRRAERNYKNNKNNKELYQTFKEKQMDSNIIMERQRNCFYTQKLSHAAGNSKETYSIINKLLDNEFGKKLQPNGEDKEIAQSVQSFFHTKIVKIYDSVEKLRENSCASSLVMPVQTEGVILSEFKLMSESEIATIIKSMSNSSCTLDPIPTWLVKECIDELLPVITHIVNSSLQTGTFPESLKTAVVRALLKKENLDPDDLSNYRPISNLSFISKVIEKCVHLQITDYVEENKLFPSLQSGYRKHHSCETAVVKIVNDLLIAIDKQSHAILVLIDLSAAFDTVNHIIFSLKN